MWGKVGYYSLLVFGIVFGLIACVLVFLGAAAFITNISLLVLLSILVLVAVIGGVTWFVSGKLFPSKRALVSGGITTSLLIVVIVAAGVTIFKPLSPNQWQPVPGPDTQYWDLPTGSHIAYNHIQVAQFTSSVPIVFVHGGPGSQATGMQDTASIQAIASLGHDVYLYDQIGGGLSARLDNIEEYTVARHVADLEAIREQIGVEKMILIGQSWGGQLIGHYMAAHPDRVEKAVFVCPSVIWQPSLPPEQRGHITTRMSPEATAQFNAYFNHPRFITWGLLLGRNTETAQNFMSEIELANYFRDMMELELGQHYIDAVFCDAPPLTDLNLADAASVAIYANVVTSSDADQVSDHRPKLATNETPVLILKGECDYLSWESTFSYKETFPNARLVIIEGAGHSPGMEKPEVYETIISEFLQDMPLSIPPYEGSEPPGTD